MQQSFLFPSFHFFLLRESCLEQGIEGSLVVTDEETFSEGLEQQHFQWRLFDWFLSRKEETEKKRKELTKSTIESENTHRQHQGDTDQERDENSSIGSNPFTLSLTFFILPSTNFLLMAIETICLFLQITR